MEVVQSGVLLKGKAGADLFQHLPCGGALKIEDTKGIAPVKDLHRPGIIHGVPACVIDPSAIIPLHQIQGIPDDGKAPVAQDIYLDQPCVLHRILFPLEHLYPAGRDFHRAVAANLIGHDHQTAAVDGKVVEVILELDRGTQNLIPGFLQFDSPHLGMVCQLPPNLLQLPAESDFAGHPADLCISQAEDLCHLPDGRPGSIGIMIGHHGGPSVSIPGEDIVNDPISFVPCDVNINVRGGMRKNS